MTLDFLPSLLSIIIIIVVVAVIIIIIDFNVCFFIFLIWADF